MRADDDEQHFNYGGLIMDFCIWTSQSQNVLDFPFFRISVINFINTSIH